jgi:hypothetical protein
MLEPALFTSIKEEFDANRVQPSPADSVSFPFLRLLLGSGQPASEEARMYETEAAQIVRGSDNGELVDGFHAFVGGAAQDPAAVARLRQLLKAEPGVSAALAAQL